MNAEQLIEKVSKINVCTNKGKRSPHKPLLILLSLGRLQQKKTRLVEFKDIEEQFSQLLTDFGPDSARKTPYHPFYRLSRDGFWECPDLNMPPPSNKYLRDHRVKAGFTKEAYELLNTNEELIKSVAQLTLTTHFPDTYYEDIINDVGLDMEFDSAIASSPKVKRKRDPAFRKRILEAYHYKCAICDFSLFLGSSSIALEAAHIQWHNVGGPDIETNGLALCSMHHKLLDRGAIAISNDKKIIVSQRVHGGQSAEDWLYNFDGKPLRQPRNKEYTPDQKFIDWHVKEVFKSKFHTK